MSILQEADKLIHGERQQVYSHPFKDFTRVAKLWSPILGVEVTPEQVALCMVQVKVSRLCHTPGHHDSIVDGAGYFGCYGEIRECRDEEAK